MKKLVIASLIALSSVSIFGTSLAATGTVIKDNVCDDKVIIESGAWYGGSTLYEGDRVNGDLISYGIKDLHNNGNESRYYIED